MINWLYLVYTLAVFGYTGNNIIESDRFMAIFIVGFFEFLIELSFFNLKSFLLKILFSPLWIGLVVLLLFMFVFLKILRKPCPSLKELDLLEYWRL